MVCVCVLGVCVCSNKLNGRIHFKILIMVASEWCFTGFVFCLSEFFDFAIINMFYLCLQSVLYKENLFRALLAFH